MPEDKKHTKYQTSLDKIDLTQEDGYVEAIQESKKKKTRLSKLTTKAWGNTIDKYLDSIEYAVDKGNTTSKKVTRALKKIPEPASKRGVQLTLVFLLVAILVFLISCHQIVP